MLWIKSFGINLTSQLNQTSGLAAIGALIFGFVGLTTSGAIRKGLFVAGGLILAAAVLPAMAKARPKREESAQDYAGDEINLAQYRSLKPRPPSIGVVGIQLVGKTSLKNYLLRHPQEHGSTQVITAVITTTLEHPEQYVAIIDGPGQSWAEQFDVANHSDFLVVLLDHNIVPGQHSIAAGRLDRHKEFGQQLRKYLEYQWTKKSPEYRLHVHILLNKKDDWQSADAASQAELGTLLSEEQAAWRNLSFTDNDVAAVEHASTHSDDVSNLAHAINRYWRVRQPIAGRS